MTPYPPAPWRLRGDMAGTFMKIPAEHLPDGFLTPGMVRRDGSVLIAVYFVDYRGGQLEYREFLVAGMIARPRYPVPASIRLIWVDSAASLAGGRELWDIPKQPAQFDFRGDTSSIVVDGEQLASYRFTPKWTVPGRWPFHISTVQDECTTRSRFVSRFQIGTGELTATGQLSFLQHATPVVHAAMRGFRATFGTHSQRSV